MHGADSDLYLFLRQALMARRALILLDGVDEGGHSRDAIERHVNEVLVPQGHHIVLTSRPAGINEDLFDRGLVHRLELQPLSDDQQATVIEQRLGADESERAKHRASELLKYMQEHVPRDAEGVRVTANPLMLSMVISIYEMNEGRGGMPTTVWELYEFASHHMLQRLDRKTGGGSSADAAAANAGFDLPQVVQAIFFQAHSAQARIIDEQHLQAAALSLQSPAELAALQSGEERTLLTDHELLESSFKKPKTLRKRIEQACEHLPDELLAAMQTVRDKVGQDRLPLLSLLQPFPLQMQSSHLSFQEFYAARAIRSGAFLLPAGAAEPWRWSAWWSNTLRLGGEMGEPFAKGLIASIGMSTSQVEHGIDLRARIAGDRPTSLLAVGILLKAQVRAADLRDNRLEDESDIERLASVLNNDLKLSSINVAGNALGARGAKLLCAQLPEGVTHLDLSRTHVCTGEQPTVGIEALFHSTCAARSLLSLKLSRNQLADTTGVLVLNALASGRAKSLSSLDLSGNRLGVKTAHALVSAFAACPSLASLILADNLLQVPGGCAVASAVATHPGLKELDLAGNHLCDGQPKSGAPLYSVEAVAAIAGVLSSPGCLLCSLGLARNWLCGTAWEFTNGSWRNTGEYTDEGVKAIVESLDKRKAGRPDAPLLHIDLGGNLVHREDAKLVMSALSHEEAESETMRVVDADDEQADDSVNASVLAIATAAPEKGLNEEEPSVAAGVAYSSDLAGGEAGATVKTVSEAAPPPAEPTASTGPPPAVEKEVQVEATAAEVQAAAEAFAAASKAQEEEAAKALAEGRAARQAKDQLRKLVGAGKDEAIERCQKAMLTLPARPEDEGVMVAMADLVAKKTLKAESEKGGTITSGQLVRVLETQETEAGALKALVQQLDATEPAGWVSMKASAEEPSVLVAPPVQLQPSDKAKKEVTVRAKPSGKAAELRKLNVGTKVRVLEVVQIDEGGKWARVALAGTDTELGWVLFISKDGAPQTAPIDWDAPSKAASQTPRSATKQASQGKRRDKVSKPEVAEEATASASSSSLVDLVKHQRLANVKNNEDKCPVRQRHDGPSRHVNEQEGTLALIFNCYKAKFEVAEGNVEGVPPSSTYNLTSVAGTVVGTIAVAEKKGVDFKERVKLKNQWMVGNAHGLFHPSDQGDASVELTFEYKTETETHRIYILVSPWLSYSCSVGARFLLKRAGDPEGRTGTIQRLLGDDRCAMRVDGESKETLIDPRPDSAIPAANPRFAPGTPILYLAGSACVDAVVEEMPEEDWTKGSRRRQFGYRLPDAAAGSKHWIRIQTEGHAAAGKLIDVDLNMCNHCVQRFATVEAYEEARLLHCADIVARERNVDDAITGNTLDIAEQLVDVSTKEGVEGSVNRLGESVRNVRDLSRILRRPDDHRRNGGHTSQPVLVRAGPGTGKTWMSKQAAYMLADQLGETAEGDVHKGVRMVPVIMYVQQIVYVLRDTDVPSVEELLEVYLRKMYSAWHVAVLMQAYDLRSMIMILDGVDEAAGMRQYIEDFVLRVLVPSGNRILITSRREGIADLTPYIDLQFTVLDLKELSNEQQRSVIRAQMDGNEFFDHVLALGEMRRSIDGVWDSCFTARERRELEGFYCAGEAEQAPGDADGDAAPTDAKLVEAGNKALPGLLKQVLVKASELVVQQRAEGGAEGASFAFKASEGGAANQVICSTAALVIALLNGLAMGIDVDLGDGRVVRVTMTAAVNKYVDLDVTHFRFASCTLTLGMGESKLCGVGLEVHHKDIKQAAGGESKQSASDHYAFFRTRMAHLAADDDGAIDRLLEPALIFLVDATGVPVLLSLLVLIFTSGGEDLTQLPKSQFELYQMGIQFAMDKRLLGSSQGVAAQEASEKRGGALIYDDKAVTAALTKRWNKLFALEVTNQAASVVGGRRSVAEAKPEESTAAAAESKKPKRERAKLKAEGVGLGMNEGGARSGAADAKNSVDVATSKFTDDDLYEIFRQGAKFVGAAARGVGRKELNHIELTMPKHLRSIVTTLVEANLKVLRDSSAHDVGLLMLRNLAILNQQNGRRQFGAGDVSQALLKHLPCPEALTLWLHLNNEEGGIPLTKTLEMQTDIAEGQYQFKHLSFQEGLLCAAQVNPRPHRPPLAPCLARLTGCACFSCHAQLSVPHPPSGGGRQGGPRADGHVGDG